MAKGIFSTSVIIGGFLYLLLFFAGTSYAEDYNPGFIDEGLSYLETSDPESNDLQKLYADGDLFTWKLGLGSAKELDGKIVVVSIFLSDKYNNWDFTNETDRFWREHSLTYLGIAADWITESAAHWGKYPEFIYDWMQFDDLYYEMEIDMEVADMEEDPTADMNEMIEEYADPEGLLLEYGADSILFLAYINSSMENGTPSFTIPYDDGLGENTMEICYIYIGNDGEEESPAAYAHEILHTFGAPDLYDAYNLSANYNIDIDFVLYCKVNHPNEIMLTTCDADTEETYYDHISNEITEITAYHIGWTDHCKEAEIFGLQESQHIP